MCDQDDAIVRIDVEDTGDGDRVPTLNYKLFETNNQDVKYEENLEVCHCDIQLLYYHDKKYEENLQTTNTYRKPLAFFCFK